jgi:hypothetical protein
MDPHSIEVTFTWSYDMPQRGDLSPVPPPKPPDVTINGTSASPEVISRVALQLRDSAHLESAKAAESLNILADILDASIDHPASSSPPPTT